MTTEKISYVPTKIEMDWFVGRTYELTGVDYVDNQPAFRGDISAANSISFTLNDVTYVATEDPSDGYRSSMDKIQAFGSGLTKNNFEPCTVACEREGDELIFTDVHTDRPVLRVGTCRNDEYYPSFVANFDPTAMYINRDVAAPESANNPDYGSW